MDSTTSPPQAAPAAKTYSLEQRPETDQERQIREAVERRAAQQHRRRQRSIMAARLAVLVVAIAVWEYGAGRWFDSFFTSQPSRIYQSLVRGFAEGEYLWHAALTITEAVSGYLIGAAIALTAAFVVTTWERLYEVVEPYVMAFYAIPRIALAPLFIIWFGIGITPKIVISALLVFFVVFMNTVAGIRSANPEILALSRLMGAHRVDLLRHVIVPSAMPFILTALRIVVPTAFIGAIVGEFISSQRGLGFMISRATFSFNIAGAMSGILILMITVLVMSFILSFIERRVLRWRPDGK